VRDGLDRAEVILQAFGLDEQFGIDCCRADCAVLPLTA
jgi:hypothetical protein